MSQYGCGRHFVLMLLGREHPVTCGHYVFGELVQCEDCQESKPAPSSADPEDADALGELEAERSFNPHHQEEPPEDGCTNPGGHEWNRTAGEADEARIARDWENDNIRCVHCGADGDA